MASYWSIGGVDIYVDQHSGGKSSVMGTQHVLDATSDTVHYSGSNSGKSRVSGTLFTTSSASPELATLMGYVDSDTARTLTSDAGSFGSFYVINVDYERLQALNNAYPVYRVNVELFAA